MYEYIKGKIVDLTPANVVVEANSIGWFINISLNTYTALSGKESAKVYVHQVIREDAHSFFGFADKDERELYRQLITVNGVGSSTAMVMLSSHSTPELKNGILTENVAMLKGIKGIGPKTAQRIIIDLKDKIGKSAATDQIFAMPDNTNKDEALSALVMLGFAKKDAQKAIDQILRENPGFGVEEVIKASLKRL
ncbi:Holliday junction branch migration protein RuvA [Prolixibacteraceae bacterium JC049]|jgi:Holliday junction DNA helicase RuvA|nr:Holliday junction branch migration protein RuvA [Prolixibacteraceae bacterium JC049]